MLIGIPALDATDRSRLLHAYGRATDTPAHLRTLLTADVRTRGAALEHLWSAIIQGSNAPADINDWFPVKPPQLPMQPRFTVIQRLLERVPDFDLVVDAAVAIARTTKKSWVDFEWGPLLVHAFRSGDGEVRTEAQRRFLAALVDTSYLWDPRFGNAGGYFRKAGLPYDREACARLVGPA